MRARNIKPGFFKNEDLVEIDPMGRLLFIGLWMMADREGRLEDRPRRIKMEVFPGDNCDVDALLDELQKWGFINRYEVDGSRYIQVLNFQKHQNPNPKEAASRIPAPQNTLENNPDCIQNISRLDPDCIQNISDTAEYPLLNPESLNTESLNPETQTTVVVAQPDEPPNPVVRLLVKSGVCRNPHDPKMLALVRNKVPYETVQEAVELAKRKSAMNIGFVVGVIENWQKQADGMKANGSTRPPGKPKSTKEQLAEYHAQKEAQLKTIDVEVKELQ